MFGFAERRAVCQAKAQYEMAVLESLMAENRARLARLAELERCPICEAMEDAAGRARCGADA